MVHKEEAAHFLVDVPGEKLFWCKNGMTFASLEELAKGLRKISKDAFVYHVNKDKNDFANWIYDVIGDTSLATDLLKVTKKTEITKKVTARIKELKQLAN